MTNKKLDKQWKLECAKDWMARTIENSEPGVAYIIQQPYLPFEPLEVLESMTAKQLKLFSCMAAASYGRGCSTTRKAWRDSKKRSKS
jgi:hypothetical protein